MKEEIDFLLEECMSYLSMETMEFVALYHDYLDHPVHMRNAFADCCEIDVQSLCINGVFIDDVYNDLLSIKDKKELREYFKENNLSNPRVSLHRVVIDKPEEFINLGKALGL